MLFSFRTLLFITSLFVSAGTWSSCIKVTDKSALSAAAIKRATRRKTGSAQLTQYR